MEFETLETERLYLKKLTPESFEYLFDTQSEEEIVRFLGLEDHQAFVREKEKSQGGYKTYDRTICAFVIVSKASGETIGRCGFHNWYPGHRKAEIGYVIFGENERCKGYMKEALKAVIDYGFNAMDLNRIEASASPNNGPSVHLLRTSGFTQEGYLRQHFMRDEVLEDSLIFSLLREEYQHL